MCEVDNVVRIATAVVKETGVHGVNTFHIAIMQKITDTSSQGPSINFC